jgi:hypothetical protein
MVAYMRWRWWAKRPRARLIGLLAAALLLASCNGFQVEDHSLQFNQATGSVGNRIMLLNAVRAAKGYPLQFSKVTSYSGQGTVDGGLSVDLPFILNTFGTASGARILGTARPSSSFKTGVSQLQLADLNTAEIQKALRTQVRAKDFAYYRSQGWQKALVNTILIEELQLEPDLVRDLGEASDAVCHKNTGSASSSERHRPVCNWLRREEVKDCLRRPDAYQLRATPYGETVRVYSNNPRKFCQHIAFQWFFASIRVLEGVSLDINPEPNVDECVTTWKAPKDAGIPKKDKDAKRGKGKANEISDTAKDGKMSVDIAVNLKVAEKGDKDKEDEDKDRDSFIALNIPKLREFLNTTEFPKFDRLRNTHLCLLKMGKKPLEIGWRSPERMVRYLGEVVAVHTLGDGDKNWPVQILNEKGELADLFRVERGRNPFGGPAVAVAVEGPGGEYFYIPPPEHGTHLSLQALALVMESFNQAVSGKALPQPSTLFLSGG